MDDVQSGLQLLNSSGARYAEGNQQRSAFPFQLPSELWPMIWEHLPFTDCLTVCAVCKEWNTLAVTTARLWTELRVASPPLDGDRAYESIDWELREEDHEDLADADMAADYVARVPGIPPGSITSISVLTRMLARSVTPARSLRLSIYVVLYAEVGETFYEELTAVLVSHKPRIVELHFFSVRPWPVHELIAALRPLDTLRSLQLHSPYDHQYADEADYNPRLSDGGWSIFGISDFFQGHHPTAFRALQSFKSSATFSWDSESAISFPQLTSLCIADCTLSILVFALAACPRLEHLVAHPRGNNPDEVFSPATIRSDALATAANLRTVRATHVRENDLQWLCPLFSSPTREAFSLSYHHDGRCTKDSPNILDDIARPTHVTATFSPLRIDIECRGGEPPNQQHRALSIPVSSLDYAWDLLERLRTAEVRTIRCSWLAWHPLSALTEHGLPALKTLELLVDDDPRVLVATSGVFPSRRDKTRVADMIATADPAHMLHLPAFRTLRICKSEAGSATYTPHVDMRDKSRPLLDVLAFLPMPYVIDVSDQFDYLAP